MELVRSVIVGDARNMMRTCDLIALQTDVKTIKVVVIDAEGKEITSAIVEEDRREGAYLKSKEHLNKIKIMLYARECDGEAKRLMEELRPHFNLKGLELGGRNLSMPSWATGYRLVKFLPNLIRLQLSNLHINNLTCLGNLPHLKTLTLEYLNELEYMIDYCVASATTCLFPSLEKLSLYYLPKLKGWRRSRAMALEEANE